MQSIGTKAIKTGRLILRRYEITDAQDMFRNWVTDPEASRFWSWEPHKGIEETKALLRGWIAQYDDPDTYQWAIVFRQNMQAIGYIYLTEIDHVAQSASVHYLVSRAYWGKGVATEALGAVLTYAFASIGAKRIHTRHHADNPASGAVMRKCGMRFVETAYRHFSDCERINGEYHLYERTIEHEGKA